MKRFRISAGCCWPFLLTFVSLLGLDLKSEGAFGWISSRNNHRCQYTSLCFVPLSISAMSNNGNTDSKSSMASVTSNTDGNPESATTAMSSSPTTKSKFRVLGVCGGIGSGKSTACQLLLEHGQCLAHIDADSMAHSVYIPGSKAIQDIVSEFGTDILLKKNDDNADDSNKMEIDRKKLGSIVFSDRSSMRKLEHIVWPHVKTLIRERIEQLKQEWNKDVDNVQTTNKRPIVVLEAAVLLDAGWDDLLDGVWVVTTPREIAMERLIQSRGLSKEEAGKRIDAQQSRRGIGSTLQQEIDNGVLTGVIENKEGTDELILALKNALDDPKFWKSGL